MKLKVTYFSSFSMNNRSTESNKARELIRKKKKGYLEVILPGDLFLVI